MLLVGEDWGLVFCLLLFLLSLEKRFLSRVDIGMVEKALQQVERMEWRVEQPAEYYTLGPTSLPVGVLLVFGWTFGLC